MDNVYDAGPDIEYFRAKLARQIEQFCRAARRGAALGHPTVEDVQELYRSTEKTRKQIELLEDSLVIYHFNHGERRNVWYVTIKNHTIAATTVIENFKEWLKDRKLP